ncbi:MAG: hypothetical protein NWE93_08160 [Candidatus Bathyarchaeota archaeon]|nr:hypothetical protein [Candidatus Bathyarchaeota archaeon]
MNAKRSLLMRIRGWFPQEPNYKHLASPASLPKTKAEPDKKAFKVAQIANGIMVAVFLGTDLLFIRPAYDSLTVSVLQWSIFIATLVSVNVLIYRNYKQRLLPKGWR